MTSSDALRVIAMEENSCPNRVADDVVYVESSSDDDCSDRQASKRTKGENGTILTHISETAPANMFAGSTFNVESNKTHVSETVLTASSDVQAKEEVSSPILSVEQVGPRVRYAFRLVSSSLFRALGHADGS
jgi:hypothetical protein